MAPVGRGAAFGLAALWLSAGVGAEPAAVDPVALRAEAIAYEHGEGVPVDRGRAVGLYCRAALAGDAESQFNLGWMYANGRGLARDDAAAAHLFGLAARQGHVQARRMLAYLGDVGAREPECLADARQTDDPPPARAAGSAPGGPGERRVLALVEKLAPQYGVHPELALAVIRAESNFNPAAVSGRRAQGLMQLIPPTSARFKVADPYDPEQNLRGGLSYLRWLLAYFKGNVALVAAGYNAGERAVDRFRGIPPFAETKAYVKRIVASFGRGKHPYDPGAAAPSPALTQMRGNRLM